MTGPAKADPLEQVAKYLEAGELTQAAGEARKILAVDPGNYLAMVAIASVAALREQPEATVKLMLFETAGAFSDPDLALAVGNLLMLMGNNEKAIAAFERTLELRPKDLIALRHLGYVRRISGNLEASIAVQEKLVAASGESSDALVTLAETLHEAGRIDQCIGVFDRAIARGAGNASIFNTLSTAHFQLGQNEQAIATARKALEYDANFVPAMINVSKALRSAGHFAESEAACRNAIKQAPGYAGAYCNLALVLNESGEFNRAIHAADKAISLQREMVEAHVERARSLRGMRRLDEAAVACRNALAVRPDNATANLLLSICLADTGRLSEAISVLRERTRQKPADFCSQGNLSLYLHYDEQASRADIFAAAREYDQRFCGRLRQTRVFENNCDPNRRLRVGYMSPDFRDHVVGLNILPFLREHDHERYEIFCYSSVIKPDAYTAKMKGYADVWRDIAALGDGDASELVRGDGIDVLVDLSLHTAGNRLLVFARKPAPVQVTFAGYPSSTGLKAIDYRLTDPYLDPPGSSDEFYSERSFRLPHSFWCFEAQASDPSVNELPALEAGHVTFGCLNTFRKISPATWGRWARVLHAVPGSELMVMAPEGSARETATRILEGQGIDPYRFRFVSAKPRSQYMSLYHRIDIGLDTLPYNGHTTSLDSYWMGVPVVTLVGKTVVGRAGLSQATNLGLTELVAYSEEEFVAIAAKLAGDLKHLAALRRGLREQMLSSPLCDAKGFTRGIEGAYRQMWQTWCEKDN
jgi:predicted O-linked N-acetylglucosamine transferase (SPINDLY family)